MHARDRKNRGESERIKRVKMIIGNPDQILNHPKNTHLAENIGNIIDMHIWTITDWKTNLDSDANRRTGLRFRYDKSVDPEVRRACIQFGRWLRSEYYFPLRVPVYVKGSKTIHTKNGENVVGTFFEPFSYSIEPYIRIATGDYEILKEARGKDNALATILASLAHELTHYYQWINNIQLTPIGRERQATSYSHYIIYEYSLTREHP